MKHIELHAQALEHLESTYNILFQSNARNINVDWGLFLEQLRKLKVEKFDANDRILVCHMDTDYYDPMLPVGVIPNNLIRCFMMLDIPLYLLLFVTNHYGISKEFDQLCAHEHPNCRPTIVETLLSYRLLDPVKNNQPLLNSDKIVKPGLCMAGAKRSHRVGLINFLKSNKLLDNVAVSAWNYKNK